MKFDIDIRKGLGFVNIEDKIIYVDLVMCEEDRKMQIREMLFWGVRRGRGRRLEELRFTGLYDNR
jgi:hypothetical protein